MNLGPVVIIEDDIEDQEMFEEAFKELDYDNEVLFFDDPEEALNHLNKTDVLPFLILSDINMPKLDGFALREKIKQDAALQVKCIPYLFFSTATSQKAVIDAYSLSVQGFFVKPNSYKELKNTLGAIMQYWNLCVAPNNFNK